MYQTKGKMSDTCGGQYIPCYSVFQQYFLNDLGLHHFFISFMLCTILPQNSLTYSLAILEEECYRLVVKILKVLEI